MLLHAMLCNSYRSPKVTCRLPASLLLLHDLENARSSQGTSFTLGSAVFVASSCSTRFQLRTRSIGSVAD